MRGSCLLLLATAASAADDFTVTLRHIALAGPGGMRVSWRTQNTSTSACTYGLSSASLNLTAVGAAAAVNYMPGHGYHHTVKLTGLAPSTTYFYRCGNASNPSGLSPIASFKSAPPAAAPGGSFAALVFGDMGWLGSKERGSPIPVGGLDANWSATLSRELMETGRKEGSYDLVFHVGDIGYQDDAFGYLDSLLNFTYEPSLDGYMAWLENVTAAIPYHVVVGNHESECHSPACLLDLDGLGLYLNNFTAYNARWAMPSLESGGVMNMWWVGKGDNAEKDIRQFSTHLIASHLGAL